MSSPAYDRREALIDLIQLRVTTAEAVEAVRGYPWDSEIEVVMLRQEDIAALLKRYIQAELSSSDLEAWANAVEGREDIGVDAAGEHKIRTFLFETANPALANPISDAYAQRWITSLSSDA